MGWFIIIVNGKYIKGIDGYVLRLSERATFEKVREAMEKSSVGDTVRIQQVSK